MLAEPLSPSLQKLRLDDDRPVEWAVSKGYVDYAAAEAFMEARVAREVRELVAGGVALAAVIPLFAASVRDGARALRIVRELSRDNRNLELAETLAMALAETGRFEEAVKVQGNALQMARGAGREELQTRLARILQDYQNGRPCRKPWQDNDPLFYLQSYGR